MWIQHIDTARCTPRAGDRTSRHRRARDVQNAHEKGGTGAINEHLNKFVIAHVIPTRRRVVDRHGDTIRAMREAIGSRCCPGDCHDLGTGGIPFHLHRACHRGAVRGCRHAAPVIEKVASIGGQPHETKEDAYHKSSYDQCLPSAMPRAAGFHDVRPQSYRGGHKKLLHILSGGSPKAFEGIPPNTLL